MDIALGKEDSENNSPAPSPVDSDQQNSSDSNCSQNNYTNQPIIESNIDDNSSFFSSQNLYQKVSVTVGPPHTRQDSESNSSTEPELEHMRIRQDSGPGFSNGQILNDSLPDINSTEDWEAAFGFGMRQQNVQSNPIEHKDPLEAFGGFGISLPTNGSAQPLNSRICKISFCINWE